MSHEIKLDPSNHQHEHESEAISNPVSSNQPSRYLLDGAREKYFEIGRPLYQASLICDWRVVEAILNKSSDCDLLRCSITENGETALHIAALAYNTKKVAEFVRYLVGKMEAKDLELLNNNHSTALYLAAAAGNVESVKIMMETNANLDTIPGGGGDMMPLYAAVLFGNKDVVRYLFKRSEDLCKAGWNLQNRTSLLEKCVESDMFDIALKIVKRHPELRRSRILLEILARKPEAFNKKKYSTINTGKHP